MKKYLAVVAVVAAAIVAIIGFVGPEGSDDVRSPRDVVGAFVYHIDHGNFGKACGLMSDELRGDLEECSSGFVFNAGSQMAFFGVDVFDGATLLPGRVQVTDESFVYRIRTTALVTPVEVLVEKRPTGRYRITRIG